MAIAKGGMTNVARHRFNLKRLVSELRKNPLKYLPERSVNCLNQFFDGYVVAGPQVWRDLLSFEFWLKKRLYYPQDAGARWFRSIELNSKDNYDSYEIFCARYDDYCHTQPIDFEPAVADIDLDASRLDFYLLLHSIERKPGLTLGNEGDSASLGAFIAGYFKGKEHSRLKLNSDEKEFFRFENWLRKHHKLPRKFPWFRIVDMWGYGRSSPVENFFAYYDAFLTNFGKRPRGLEEKFETVSTDRSTVSRRRKKLPKQIILSSKPKYWWRSRYNNQ